MGHNAAMKAPYSMFARFVLAVMIFAPIPAKADSALGGSYAKGHQSGGPFEGTGTGYKFFLGSYGTVLGGEFEFVDFRRVGGDGPRAQAFGSALTVGYPISMVTPFGKVGLAYSRVNSTASTSESKHYGLYYGLGLRFGGVQGFGLRVEYERFRLASDHTDLASVGIEYRY